MRLRIWNKKQKEWFVSKTVFLLRSPEIAHEFELVNRDALVPVFSVGITDKKKKQLFEGSIIEIDIMGEKAANPYKFCLSVVVTKFGCAGYVPAFPELQHEDDMGWRPFYNQDDEESLPSKYFLVVGHKFSNPELLK